MKQAALNARAFTILETLSSLAIVALLAAMASAAHQHMRMSAERVVSSANLRQLAQANLSYAVDHGTFVPAADIQNLRRWHGARRGYTDPYDPATGFLSPYLGGDRRVGICPVMKRALEKAGASFELGSGGYGYNATYLGGMRESLTDRDGAYIPPRVTLIRHPSQTLMFATTAYANGKMRQEYPFCEPPFWDFGYGPSPYRPSPTLDFRFRGKAIVAWCDGHLSFETREDRPAGYNPHGGDADALGLGWFGPDESNGYWNPENTPN